MASGRVLSPDFWTDAVMIGLPIPVRLFYVGTWNFACSAGHIKDDPMQIRLQVLPADDIDGEAFVQMLVDKNRMVRFELRDGSKWLLIRRMSSWQKQDKRFQSRCPACREQDIHADSPQISRENPKSPQLSAQGGEGEGRGNKGEGTPAPYCAKHPGGTDRPCGPCRTARLEYEGQLQAKKTEKATVPAIKRNGECTVHNWPMPCPKCKE